MYVFDTMMYVKSHVVIRQMLTVSFDDALRKFVADTFRKNVAK